VFLFGGALPVLVIDQKDRAVASRTREIRDLSRSSCQSRRQRPIDGEFEHERRRAEHEQEFLAKGTGCAHFSTDQANTRPAPFDCLDAAVTSVR
jgi:hypothetical protein